MDVTRMRYTIYSNHLSTAVSELPELFAKHRKTPTINTSYYGSSGSGIYNEDGSINTGYIFNWRPMSRAYREKVYAKRNRVGIRFIKRGSPNPKIWSFTTVSISVKGNILKQLVENNNKYKRKIKVLKLFNPDSCEKVMA